MANSRGSGYEPPVPQPGPNSPYALYPQNGPNGPYPQNVPNAPNAPYVSNGPNDPYAQSGPQQSPATSGAHRAGHQSAGSGGHRRRRRKSGAGRIGLAGGLAGAMGIGAVAVLIVVFRHDGAGHTTDVQIGSSSSQAGGAPQVPAPRTGAVLSLATPDGFTYGLGAIQGGTTVQPLAKGGTPPPSGTAFAYADYIFVNTGGKPALLDFTAADLFVKKARVADSAQARCMPQPGTPDDMCTLPNSAAVISYVDGSKPPTVQAGDQYMPPGAKYRIRVETTLPVLPGTTQADMSVYVWQARFIANRQAVQAAFP